ncbi:MAG: ChaN family lipoprotein [Alphaproteobacteria bacterium]|uniref:ChaN family lipoprotein n=1 Tax=Candidatus Nitrobium versatile TaxID=2884831 RepID=A0A953M364_9BACT|nr:ChaN family lipoprotein [Candidatus Nitrobium versatile]
MRRIFISFPLSVFLSLAGILLPLRAGAAEDNHYPRVLRVQDGKIITFDQMIRDIGRTRAVFVGESHGNSGHHKAQLAVIKKLRNSRIPLAVGLEMFRANSQEALNRWIRGEMTLQKFLRIYYDNWSLPWALYSDIFFYAREKGIPLVGLNIPRHITRKVARKGFSSLTPSELKELPPGITCDVDREYMDFIRRMYKAHNGRGTESFTRFCEAQMIWDKVMAWHLTAYLKQHPGSTVVVLAGTGHSWKRGIPAQLRKDSGFACTVILPEPPGGVRHTVITPDDADYLFLW